VRYECNRDRNQSTPENDSQCPANEEDCSGLGSVDRNHQDHLDELENLSDFILHGHLLFQHLVVLVLGAGVVAHVHLLVQCSLVLLPLRYAEEWLLSTNNFSLTEKSLLD